MTGKPLARFWLHCNFITIDGEKVSKSLGNVYTLDDLSERGFSPLDYKMWVLSGHYRGERNFTFESLEGAKARRLAWRNRIALLYQVKPMTEPVFQSIIDAVNNNLNSPEAFAIIDASNLAMEDWGKVDELFGLNLIADTPNISEKTYALISEREEARKAKDFARSDEIRNELLKQGIAVRDTAEGPIWAYIA